MRVVLAGSTEREVVWSRCECVILWLQIQLDPPGVEKVVRPVRSNIRRNLFLCPAAKFVINVGTGNVVARIDHLTLTGASRQGARTDFVSSEPLPVFVLSTYPGQVPNFCYGFARLFL